ncbi:MAG: serine/threonine protein kinase [Rivularia sp. (in: Bacteria)]|nr:serine/threonine protein kinase [Rivularia sp. MS3]
MIGNLICDRYQVIKILNQGMFCQTYIARDITIADYPTCVVKHFLPSDRIVLPVKTRRRLFTREVKALMKLDSYEYVPHLLNYFEQNQEFYLVQEFIQGHSLSSELKPGKRWSENKVIELLQEVSNILVFVHSQGLIHRDVKPSNIMRRERDNRLVLIDFGAVKPMWNELVKNQHISDSTTIAIGTPGYMPYEQHQGKPVPSSDIYALGTIAIQAFTGIHPIELPKNPKTGEIVWRHLVCVNQGLAKTIDKMVSYHSQDRYDSAVAVLAALMQVNNLNCTASSTKKNNSILGAVELAPQLNEFSSKPTDAIASQKLLSPAKSDLDSQTWNDEMKTASESDTVVSIFPHKSALYIGLVIGVVSGFALIFISYFSIQTIDSMKIQNLQIKNLSSP